MGLDHLKALNPKGIIFTGGPQSVYKEESQHIDPAIFSMGIPILGICYGAQLIAYELGGVVKTAPVSEYGHTKVLVDRQDSVLQGISDETTMWMSHTDYIAEVLLWHCNLNLHDRLKENWVSLSHSLLECHRTSDVECHL